MTENVGNVLALIPATTLLAAGLFVIGLGAKVAVRRWTALPSGWSVTVAVGGALAALLVLATRLAGHLLPGIVLAAVAGAVGLIGVGLWRDRPRGRYEQSVRALATPHWSDAVAVASALIVLSPVLRFGPTVWTTGITDIFNYMASAQIWLDPEQFADRHADSFGALQLNRASFEKPVMTGFVLATGELTGTGPLSLLTLLTPITFVLLVTLIGCLLVAVAQVFGLGVWPTVLAVAIPSVALVPMSRVFDAQIGQLGAVAFVAAALALLSGTVPTGRRGAWFVTGLLWAVPALAAVGANFSLVAGCLPVIAVLALWCVSRGAGVRAAAPGLVTMAVAMALAALPLVSMFRTSFGLQSGGEPGFQALPAPPWAFVGLLTDVRQGAPPLAVSIIAWAIAVAALLVTLAWVRRSRGVSVAWPVALVLVGIGNVALVIARVGADDYATHKWTAVYVSLAVPFLIATLLALPERLPPVVLWLGTALLVVDLAVTIVAGSRTGRVPRPVLELAEAPALQGVDTLNIDMGPSTPANLAAALSAANPHIVLLGGLFAPADAPVGDDFLVPAVSATEVAGTPVNPAVWLARRDLLIEPGDYRFDSAHPRNDRFLYGRWLPPDPDRTWTTGPKASIVFDAPARDLRRGLELTLMGGPATAGTQYTIAVDSVPVVTATPASPALRPIRFSIPADPDARTTRRVIVSIQSPAAAPPPGQRPLSFAVAQLRVRLEGGGSR